MKANHLHPSPRRFVLMTAGLTLAVLVPAFADSDAKPDVTTTKPAETPLLSFFDGALVFDFEERLRFEARSNNRDFNDAVNDSTDDSWLLSRFRLGVALKPTAWLKVYGQLHDTREWDSDRVNIPGVNGTEGGDTFDLRQANVELGNAKEFPLSVMLGRQALNYENFRLVADPNWGNFGRTFDGVKLRYQKKGVGFIDLWAARPVQIKEEVINDSDSADNFLGLFASLGLLPFQTTDLYLLYRDKADNQPDLDPTNKPDPRGTWTGPAQRTTTVGTRWISRKDALQGWDYTGEFAFQFGDLWTGDRTTPRLGHRAFATALVTGYTFTDLAWKPRVGVEYDYASGDKNPDDGKSQSFQNLFASNHAHYGFMDIFDWRNLHDARFALSAQPVKTITATFDYHAFWLAETTDYWARSNNGNSTLRTKTPAGVDVRRIKASNFAGQELDFTITWKPAREFNLLVGYSHFFPGAYLRDTGPADAADFGYMQAQVLF